jgi:hypothetical protein
VKHRAAEESLAELVAKEDQVPGVIAARGRVGLYFEADDTLRNLGDDVDLVSSLLLP